MKKYIFVFLGLILFLAIIHDAFAATLYGAPSIYNVTFKKLEMRKDDGTWVTIKEEDQTFNVAAANAGAQIGSYASGNFPVGHYDRFRVTVSATLGIKGRIYKSPTTTYYTKATGTASTAGDVAEADLPTTGSNAYAEYQFTVTSMEGAPAGDTLSGGNIIHEEADDFTITAGESLSETLYVDVSTSLQLPDDNQLYPAPFVVDDTP